MADSVTHSDSRFASVDEQDISTLLKEDSGSTKKCMQGSARLFRTYLANSGSSTDFENLTNSELKNKGDIRNERPLLTEDCGIIAVLHVRDDGTL